ncbi:hypothetical protein B0H12DRAFT_743148 [Mycena haematopus]|nr:hypothetical protein B0H12DRAFT_743148 [Mycena haematopus]
MPPGSPLFPGLFLLLFPESLCSFLHPWDFFSLLFQPFPWCSKTEITGPPAGRCQLATRDPAPLFFLTGMRAPIILSLSLILHLPFHPAFFRSCSAIHANCPLVQLFLFPYRPPSGYLRLSDPFRIQAVATYPPRPSPARRTAAVARQVDEAAEVAEVA